MLQVTFKLYYATQKERNKHICKLKKIFSWKANNSLLCRKHDLADIAVRSVFCLASKKVVMLIMNELLWRDWESSSALRATSQSFSCYCRLSHPWPRRWFLAAWAALYLPLPAHRALPTPHLTLRRLHVFTISGGCRVGAGWWRQGRVCFPRVDWEIRISQIWHFCPLNQFFGPSSQKSGQAAYWQKQLWGKL